jgi:signal transduction histidine kinase
MLGIFESRSIKDVIQSVCQEQSPDAALQLLVRGVVSVTGSVFGKLYLLSLKDSCFRVEFEEARGSAPQSFPVAIALEDLAAGAVSDSVSLFLKAISQKLTESTNEAYSPVLQAGFLYVPVIRNASLLGLLVLGGAFEKAFNDKDLQTAETAVAIVIMLLEKRGTLELFQSSQHPVDFFLPLDEFLEELLLLVGVAAGMRYVILRELQPDGRTLKCLSAFGFSETDVSSLDLTPIGNYPTFQKAINDKVTQTEPHMNAPHLESIRLRPEFLSIRSCAVTPIKVGNGVFGTLSFAAEWEYNYSPLELAGFESIANSIGVAISNHRNAERVHEVFAENAKVAISFTALEVAQAARHEARGSIDNAQSLLAHLLTRASLGKQDREENSKLIDKIGDSLLEVSKSIDKIRVASQIPKMELRTVSVRELWQQAIGTIASKIKDENVHTQVEGGAEISAYPETLRLAFLNLILNSLDAFRDWGKKSGRKINIYIDSRAEDAQQIKIRYYDNASGIDPNRLKLPLSVSRGQNVKDLIFELGVTSKENGSGYGLYLVRRILDDHRGSIELVDHRGGVTFDLFLPKHQTVAAQTAKN